MLDGVFDILQWNGTRREALDLADSAYTSLLAVRVGASLSQLEAAEPALAAKILGLLTALDAASLRRVLLAPETSSRLLWDHPGHCDDRDLWQYLADVLEIETARLSPIAVQPSTTGPLGTRWSALGDLGVNDAGEMVVSQPPLAGLLIDADSPAAVCFDGSSLHDGSMRLQHYRDPSAKQVAMHKVESAMSAIDSFATDVADFVRRFTLVSNIVADSESSRFSSGSTGEYIGRSMFINAHLPVVDTETLADSLVHEAIHALLYMHEVREPWVLCEELLPSEVVVESPWTASRLRLRNFLQACFVWFGLAHFWTLARHRSQFEAHRVEEGLATARRGFLEGPLLARIGDCAPRVAPQLLELIQMMQEDVVSGARHSTATPTEAG